MNRPNLSKTQRDALENLIKKNARPVVEKAARHELTRLGIPSASPPTYLSEDEKTIRRDLRVHGRQLGDHKHGDDSQDIDLLVEEIGYEHWHRMLFARFLIENELLIHPEHGVALSADELEHAAQKHSRTMWQQAGLWACKMLPQIFRNDHPAFWIRLDDIAERELEGFLSSLPKEVFTAGDSLGWVYQFWQTQRKDEVNKSEVKIGARELPAVTQLFTEPYMVSFLLDNGLGAWWAAQRLSDEDLFNARSEAELRQKAAVPGVPLDYLRFVKTDGGAWEPAAGIFVQWPQSLSEFKVLDPCCGSGHFLVALLEMLVPLRMQLEGLSAKEACKLVLSQNLHGLELDKRCVELAAFNLALAAWRFPGAGGYRPLPELHVACSGLGLGAAKQEWSDRFALKGKNQKIAMEWLYETFQHAPVLGSLINPTRMGNTVLPSWQELSSLFLDAVKTDDHSETHEAGVVAQGLTKAAELLATQFDWVITNPPYLGSGDQCELLRDFCKKHYSASQRELGPVFLERCLEFCKPFGVTSLVLKQEWLFLSGYKKLREKTLKNDTWHMVIRLGEHGFESQAAAGAFPALSIISKGRSAGALGALETFDSTTAQWIRGVDVMDLPNATEKAAGLISAEVKSMEQEKQLENPDARIGYIDNIELPLLKTESDSRWGLRTADTNRFIFYFWEISSITEEWSFHQSSIKETSFWSGRSYIIFWQNGKGIIKNLADLGLASIQGEDAWGKKGIVVSLMRTLPITIYSGNLFDNNCAVIWPNNEKNLNPIYAFCASSDFNKAVRQIDQKMNLTNQTLLKIPFNLDHWQKVAEEQYPNSLPKPYTNDPTQWIFHGHPTGSVVWDEATKRTTSAGHRLDATVLQVAVTRLLGYRWPAELDPAMELAPEQRAWVDQCTNLLPLADDDGIVCIPPVRGERAATERLRAMLQASYGGTVDEDFLLATCDCAGLTLETWLRDKFFEQHCKLFGHRPFVWHIWDGDPKGFSALVNYHKLDTSNLERLTYTYLGDWINQKDEEAKRNVAGADVLAQKARALQGKLKLILAGEAPYDIFVRWKPLKDQPLGWNPDLNDGVRLNIRPFVTAEVLRHYKKPKLNINWDKDRGKDVESAPWYPVHKGERINDWHTTLEEKKRGKL